MSNFPVWWDSTITVYNKFEDPATHIVTWYSTILSNCFWKHSDTVGMSGNTMMLDKNILVCRVPANEAFVAPEDWISLDNKYSMFTFQLDDIIVKGESDFEINEYQAGKRSSDMLAKFRKYGDCMTVKFASINTQTSLIQPHYLIRGV